MARVLLGATGSVAAIKIPELYSALRAAGHEVRIVATSAATYFFRPEDVAPHPERPSERDPSVISLDEDEWPRDGYQRGDPVLHIELRRWAEVCVIAPLDANTLAKLAGGLCDNCLTCVWRAWDPGRPVVLAPAMNTLMWEHPLTLRHLRSLAIDFAGVHVADDLNLEAVIKAINEGSASLRIVEPMEKALACGDIGVGAMGEPGTIVTTVAELVS